jgi:hypothetical protein
MSIDIYQLPQTIDALHLALGALVLLLMVLLIVLMKKNQQLVDGAAVLKQSLAQQRARNQELSLAQQQSTISRPTNQQDATEQGALQLLGLFQQQARLVDFLQEDISQYSDQDVGAAARIVHQGSNKVLQEHVQLSAIRNETEDSTITLAKGFDASTIRLVGNVVGQPPFTGKLVHRGWQARQVTLPQLNAGHDSRVLAPAEIEL